MKRILTAVCLIPPVLYLIFKAPGPLLLAAVALVALLCFYEYAGLVRAYGYGSLGPVGYVAGLVLLLAPEAGWLLLVLLALLALTLVMRRNHVAAMLPEAGMIVFGLLYIFGTWRCAPALRQLSPHWLFFALVLNWLGDSAAYYTGRACGKHKMAPLLSPKKTWEGAAASVVAAVVFGVVYMGRFAPAVPWWEVAALAAVANSAGQVGDLAESAIKRGAGVKDSGSLLPGHGGWLDRLDSTLFSMPVVYLWLTQPWRW